MSSQKHWSPGSDISVQSVERSDTGGRPAEQLLHRLVIGVSDDTVLRQLKCLAVVWKNGIRRGRQLLHEIQSQGVH